MCEALAVNNNVDLVVNHNNQKWQSLKENYNLKTKIDVISLNNNQNMMSIKYL